MIRKITQDDYSSFQDFCSRIGTKELLEDSRTFWGIFNNTELQGYTVIDFQVIKIPLIDDFRTIDHLEPSLIEGLIRGTLHYCSTRNYESVAVRDIEWINHYLKEAIDNIEKKTYNNVLFYEINLQTFFNKPCKGRSLC